MPSQTQSDIIATLSSCALSDIDAVLTPGECNVMLAFVDDAARNLSDLEALRAELAELRAQVPELECYSKSHQGWRACGHPESCSNEKRYIYARPVPPAAVLALRL